MADKKMNVSEIIDKMIEIHTIKKDFETGGIAELAPMYQNYIDHCPKGETEVLKALKFDLKRLTEYEHHLPDLTSSITWKRISEEYKKKEKEENEEKKN